MGAGANSDFAGRLTRALMPDPNASGVEYGICEQMLADALAMHPLPRTLRELVLVLRSDCHHRGSVALEFLAALRLLALEMPDRSLDDLAR